MGAAHIAEYSSTLDISTAAANAAIDSRNYTIVESRLPARIGVKRSSAPFAANNFKVMNQYSE